MKTKNPVYSNSALEPKVGDLVKFQWQESGGIDSYGGSYGGETIIESGKIVAIHLENKKHFEVASKRHANGSVRVRTCELVKPSADIEKEAVDRQKFADVEYREYMKLKSQYAMLERYLQLREKYA